MSELSDAERAELIQLRARVEELERERFEQVAATNRAVAAAQERAYWLDRWHLDLNGLMERPGAAEFRFAIRVVREAIRNVRRAKRKLLR
ncbi:hypothetical protein C8N24_2728 [Solirubrobacter pauli]|uniref:Uncharacterized protein n=1 Tax=Solirubrobacter pauli TaxID=166793 RepID=A0A660LCZ1_9ACTN|nr:hypothetical protein [Solirubrobacter pauli]RKQ92872.1 hypothetical protein C8N24_2728 [Solirubrobacter pauli]